jgi:hypothetical protein
MGQEEIQYVECNKGSEMVKSRSQEEPKAICALGERVAAVRE